MEELIQPVTKLFSNKPSSILFLVFCTIIYSTSVKLSPLSSQNNMDESLWTIT